MIAHTSLPVSDYARSKDFYAKILAPLGYTRNMEYGESAGFNDGKNTDFWISTGEDGKRAKGTESVTKSHVAFEAKNKEEVDNFYKAALANGGKDNGSPGYRKEYWPGYYAAFIHDPDGHNIEVVWFDYEAK